MNLSDILLKLKNVQRHGEQYQAQCPAHDDKNASLSITEKNGKVLFHCHAGCDYRKVMDSLGISKPDKPTISKIYDYRNADGSLNFQVCRFMPKTFRQRKSENEWTMKDVQKTLYKLPELTEANKSKLVFICEGEKDVDTLFEKGFLATCNAGGAISSPYDKKWLSAYTETLSGCNICIIEDKDEPGRKHAASVAEIMQGKASTIRIIECPDANCQKVKDATDYFNAGGTVEELKEIVRKAAIWKGEPKQNEPLQVQDTSGSDPVSMAKNGEPYPMTDAGNAERFAYYNQGNICFDSRANSWRIFNGKYWRIESEVYRLGIETARRIKKEAEVVQDRNLSQQLFTHAIRTESKPKLDAMLAISESMMAVDPGKFDADIFLFNCQNGTINLKTGQLKPHDKNDYITKISPVEYEPETDTALFMSFLCDLTGGDSAVVESLQKLVGYTLSGDVSEESVQIAIGRENTGKTTLLEAMKTAWGTYAATINFETLVRKKGDSGISNDIARLAGARLVSGDEVDEGKNLAEGLLKAVSGGNTLVARFLHKEFFEFQPQFKLWLAANHAPKVSAEDGAIWRRLIRLPFDHIVPKEKRDKSLKLKLKNPDIGGRQILKFAVDGCLLWQKEGLKLADAIVTATEKYREECDTLKDYFEECCQFIPGAWTSSKDIQDNYNRFCNVYTIRYPVGFMKLQEKLKTRNCESMKKFNQRGWCGISLNSVQVSTGCTPISYNPSCETYSKEIIENGVQGVQRCTNDQQKTDLFSVKITPQFPLVDGTCQTCGFIQENQYQEQCPDCLRKAAI